MKLRTKPSSEADTIIGVLIVFFELTELMNEKLKAEQENYAKTAFLAKMSHEIRTPMNAITGISELILREEISPIVREYAIDVKNSSANLLSIINDILDFSKIESGKMEIVTAKYQFTSLINDVITIIRMRLREKQVHLVVNVDCTLPNYMIGDEVRIRQILLNLMSNAAKYTHEGCIHLKIRGESNPEIEKKNTGLVTLIFEITDTGIGIKEENIGKLFGDFVQFDTEKNKNVEGAGLGLAITRKLCLAMGGDVTVASRYGEGSSFTAIIPQEATEYIPLAAVEDAETKGVLLYKTIGVHTKSTSDSLDNLGIQSRVVINDDELSAALAEKSLILSLCIPPLLTKYNIF
jgi:signal transduction histidine kinase